MRRKKMSANSVEQIIRKALVDDVYRELLFNEPDKALEGYELTEEEESALKSIERDVFDSVASEIEERISRAGFASIGTREINLSIHKLFGGRQTEIVSLG
jgi:hypothetical protein